MLCILFLWIILVESCGTTNVGTTLFHSRFPRAECWSQDDLAKLRARKLFQHIMPSPVTPDKITSRYIKDIIRYYHRTIRTTEHSYDNRTAALLKEALADAIGGYLRSELLPTVRFAYYAGYVPYRHARELEDLFDNLKTFLNTQGRGWREPRKVPPWSNLTVVKIFVGSGGVLDPCSWLITKRDANACIHLPPPTLDDAFEPSAIALPFKTRGLYSLASPHSENVLLKYYTTAARCILRSSPKSCRHSDFVNFNNELWHWMKRDVAPHLVDEKLYGAYGGVLRIAAAVQSYGKGLSRRNLFENQNIVLKWHPWRALKQSNVYIDADWMPMFYIGLVLLAVFGICLLQICCNYTFSDARGCYCKRSKTSFNKKVSYANVDTNFPAMLPDHTNCRTKNRVPSARPKTVASVKTRVYDLNENAEKLMDVVMSESEETATDSPYDSKQESDRDVITLRQKRVRSPPQLQTPIAQLKIKKTQDMPRYTPSHATYCRKRQESESMVSESSSSSLHSMSSGSSRTSRMHSRKTLHSRDLAWARRVAHKAHAHSG